MQRYPKAVASMAHSFLKEEERVGRFFILKICQNSLFLSF
ncbi:hypothetical protein ELI_3673 [Eubacterium callanderi]|uniref:Uncharacterized protein n=1 Tax=Eubacterium callanderi TaxID=53442 RepID=E3GPQ0_9FIRM|nr:hypothetical protein ELI_3673 [Eubacterium callanderi]